MDAEQGEQELAYITPDDGTASDAAEAASEHDFEANADTDLEAGEGDDQLDAEDEQDEDSESEDQTEEIELSGKKYKIPKDLKPHLMMQADYTRKTQEIAEARRMTEAREAQIQQQAAILEQRAAFQQQNLEKVAELKLIDKQLAEYGNVDWDKWEQTDPFAAQSNYRKFMALKDQRQQTVGNLQRIEHEARQQAAAAAQHEQRALAIAREEAAGQTLRVLQKEIKGWNDKVASEVSAFASGQGYSRDELVNAAGDPRAFKLLYNAMQFDRLMEKQKAAAAPKTEQAKPLTKVQGRKAPAPGGLDDGLSADEWVRRRNEQLRKRA